MDDALAIFFFFFRLLMLWDSIYLWQQHTVNILFGIVCFFSFPRYFLVVLTPENVIILQSVIHSSIYCTQFWKFPKPHRLTVNGLLFSLSLYLCLSWHKWSFDIDASNFVSLVIRLFLILSLSISFNNILFVIRFSSKPISKLMSFWCCKFHSWLFFVYCFFALDLVLLLLQLRCCYWCVNILSTRICIDAIEVSFVNRIFMHKCRYRIQPSSIYSNEWFIDASKYMEQIQNFHWNETGRERGELYIRTANNMIKFKTNTANEPS